MALFAEEQRQRCLQWSIDDRNSVTLVRLAKRSICVTKRVLAGSVGGGYSRTDGLSAAALAS